MLRDELLRLLDQLFKPTEFDDYCPNGLQIEGKSTINKVVGGVSLTQELIDYAIEVKADALIVHHGIFWQKDPLPITGIKYQRIAKIIKHELNLFAYHLPLDNHPRLGNNYQLAQLLKIKILGQVGKQNLLWHGMLKEEIRALDFAKFYKKLTKHQPQLFAGTNQLIKKIAWCTGGADSFFLSAIELGVDCFISGEVSEPIMALAKESGVAYLAGGHYVTERYGIKALINYLAFQKLETEFVELYNPI